MKWLLILGACLAASGCSSFNQQWRNAALFPSSGDLQGRWRGVWVSDVNGHTDKLRCVIAKDRDANFTAHFKATYRKVLSFAYTVSLKTEPNDTGFRFRGEANLGWLAGGRYRYEGSADATNFISTYSCKYDHGMFRMDRLP